MKVLPVWYDRQVWIGKLRTLQRNTFRLCPMEQISTEAQLAGAAAIAPRVTVIAGHNIPVVLFIPANGGDCAAVQNGRIHAAISRFRKVFARIFAPRVRVIYIRKAASRKKDRIGHSLLRRLPNRVHGIKQIKLSLLRLCVDRKIPATQTKLVALLSGRLHIRTVFFRPAGFMRCKDPPDKSPRLPAIIGAHQANMAEIRFPLLQAIYRV